jgi:predicted transcriptional regulator
MIQAIFETKDLLNNVEKHIASSQYKVEYIIKKLGITKATYYKKIRERRFDIDELMRIFSIIYPMEYESVYIGRMLEEAISQAKEGLVFTTDEVLNRCDAKYLKNK